MPSGEPSSAETADLSDDPIFRAHEGGKVAIVATKPLLDRDDLALLYTPGVAKVSEAIAKDSTLAARYTARANTVAIISDGTAVLGLGNIGPLAAMPVMEGKAVLFKQFGGVDAIPLCIESGTVEEIVDTIIRLAPSFGGINLEDISAPRCFEIEERLNRRLDIPVFHDDQHGTAIVVLAGLLNAARVLGREVTHMRVVISGAGAAGVAVAKLLLAVGIDDLVVCDSQGILGPGRVGLGGHKARLVATSNPRGLDGPLADALVGADVFIGVSGGTVPEDQVASMSPEATIFALANPTPEVHPEIAARHAAVVATGRSDYPNQINNVLAFPGIFRGALDCGAGEITEAMKLAAARAIASLVSDPTAAMIVPSVFDDRVAPAVAAAVAATHQEDSRLGGR
ncbi:MAG: NADP-dependent malic enzyme [Actinobacteria bacterium]|nr:NADP-dependent malic enzyme [Actinomycetota bacterium]